MARTLAGRDFQARTMADGSDGDAGVNAMRPADYIALSTDNAAEDDTNTTLPGEIITGSLVRAQGIYAHTTGQATYTLSKTFTSDDTLEVFKIGIFNDPTVGTLVFETLLGTSASLIPGDQVLITETVTL